MAIAPIRRSRKRAPVSLPVPFARRVLVVVLVLVASRYLDQGGTSWVDVLPYLLAA